MSMMKLEFTVPESYHGRRLSDFLHAAGLTTGLIRSIKYQQQGLAVNGRGLGCVARKKGSAERADL